MIYLDDLVKKFTEEGHYQIYENGWSGYDGHGCITIFQREDNSYFYILDSSSCMASGRDDPSVHECTEDEALALIIEWDEDIAEWEKNFL
jgi:hypothetical protein